LRGGRGVRTVTALVKLAGQDQPNAPPIRVVRWYDVDF
jgi:hypothetical protein